MPGKSRAGTDKDPAFLKDIVDSCDLVMAYVVGKTFLEFMGDRQLQDAVERRIFVIGEASKKLSEAARKRHPSVKWREIIGMREKLAHDYWQSEAKVAWDVATKHASVLREALASDEELLRAMREI
jgi:uncharacterized protein with HEPN domain